MNDEARTLIARLGLVPLPEEGGFYRRTWTSSVVLTGGRSAGSAITFLLTDTAFSALHQLQTDELWCFHGGDSVEHVQLSATPPHPLVVRLGANPLEEESPQLLVRGGNWQGARLLPHTDRPAGSPGLKGWALMSCIMIPAWNEAEFTLGVRAQLLAEFPLATPWVLALTR